MIYSGRHFAKLYDDEGDRHFTDLKFEQCSFSNCFFSMPAHILRRSSARNIQFIGCEALSVNSGPAIVEDVLFEELKTHNILLLWSPFLNRTTFRGRIGEVKFNRNPSIMDRSPETQAIFAQARAAHYASIEWALDLREGVFDSFSISGVPLSLIRRNPATQMIVKREKASNPELRARVAPWNTYWLRILDVFLGDPDDEFLLVSPLQKTKKKTQERIDGLRNLQDVGIAEID